MPSSPFGLFRFTFISPCHIRSSKAGLRHNPRHNFAPWKDNKKIRRALFLSSPAVIEADRGWNGRLLRCVGSGCNVMSQRNERIRRVYGVTGEAARSPWGWEFAWFTGRFHRPPSGGLPRPPFEGPADRTCCAGRRRQARILLSTWHIQACRTGKLCADSTPAGINDVKWLLPPPAAIFRPR